MSNLDSFKAINYYRISERVENYEFCSVEHQRKKKGMEDCFVVIDMSFSSYVGIVIHMDSQQNLFIFV
jgi:predicted rRNA methylase YqxC with S4 and FtsJ domains